MGLVRAREEVSDDAIDLRQKRSGSEFTFDLDDTQMQVSAKGLAHVLEILARKPPVGDGTEALHRLAVDLHETVEALPRVVNSRGIPSARCRTNLVPVALACLLPEHLDRLRQIDRHRIQVLNDGSRTPERLESREQQWVKPEKDRHDPLVRAGRP